MDIMHLVDRLEELFNQSRPIPFTHNVIVDEERMLNLIDQMRVAIPDEQVGELASFFRTVKVQARICITF